MVEQLTNQLGEGGSIPTSPLQFTVREIPPKQTYEWLMKKHYAKRIPQIQYAFGLYDEVMIMQGVCTFGIPPSAPLVENILSGNYKSDVIELNRLVINENLGKNLLSYFVSKSLKYLPRPKCVISFADPNNGHHGYIYQATNWIYTGEGVETPNFFLENNEQIHSKWVKKFKGEGWNIRSEFQEAKHRYVYFLGNRETKADMLKKLKYPILPYPKGDNQRYDASYEPPAQGVLV